MRKDVEMVKRINFTKARILYPFAERYRRRARIAHAPGALRIIAGHIIVTNDHRLAFVKNSKAGCSTVAQVLYYHNYKKEYEGNIHDPNIGLIQGGDFTYEGVKALTDESVYKFTFVRNPTTRIISAFHNFVLEKTNRSASKHLKHLQRLGYRNDNTPDKNFDAFLNYVEHCFQISRDYTDPHFRLQTINIAHGWVNYNHIAKLENYSEELRFILKESGVWNQHYSRTLCIKANASMAARYSPSSEQFRRIEQLYAEDYDVFDYSLFSAPT